MSNIQGLGNTPNIQRLQPTAKAAAAYAAEKPTSPAGDQVNISGDVRTQMLAKLKSAGDVRTDKVADIRAQIEAGTYETPDKIDAAIDKLFDDLV